MTADTRDRLIDAAIESIYQHGYADTTVAKISELAEVSQGVMHHHFAGKEELLAQAMAHLLEVMHRRVVEGCAAAVSPRGKLWAVIEAVLGEEQSDKRTSAVWLAFWVHSEHHKQLRQARDIYNRRLLSNVRGYLRQVFVEIGATGAAERADYGATMIISLLHGAWLSHTLQERGVDLHRARLLVWEAIEMLISRARERLRSDKGLVATSSSLLAGSSIELTSADIAAIGKWRRRATDVEVSRVFVPHFRGGDYSRNVRAAGELISAGLQPVAHLAARNVRDADELERMVASMSGIGVREFLLLGGGENPPQGKFDSALQMLESGVFVRHRPARIAFAGHPEEHPEQEQALMRKALKQKINTAQEMGLSPYIVTQFCFAATPFFEFLDWLKDEDICVPVRIGLAGRVSARKLMKFAVACGIGRSLSFFRRQFNKTVGLVNYSPEGLLAEVSGRIAVRSYQFPVGVHFYPFGAVAETLAVVSDAADFMQTADAA
ncbi:MAG: transcriptional regulator BetI [Gammaproteobacteria bacterium]